MHSKQYFCMAFFCMECFLHCILLWCQWFGELEKQHQFMILHVIHSYQISWHQMKYCARGVSIGKMTFPWENWQPPCLNGLLWQSWLDFRTSKIITNIHKYCITKLPVQKYSWGANQSICIAKCDVILLCSCLEADTIREMDRWVHKTGCWSEKAPWPWMLFILGPCSWSLRSLFTQPSSPQLPWWHSDIVWCVVMETDAAHCLTG